VAEPLISLIVPVRDRPERLVELLESLVAATPIDASAWELIVVEDGSRRSARHEIERFRPLLPLQYIETRPRGRAAARNLGASRARGRYLHFLDSDCEAPASFLIGLLGFVAEQGPHYWGGADRARVSYAPWERATAFTMDSLLTTGGLRRGGSPWVRYWPRGMNLGLRADLFHALGGFRDLNGEDIEIGVRAARAGFAPRYLPALFVYHHGRAGPRAFLQKAFEAGSSKASVCRSVSGSLQPLYFLPTLALLLLPLALSATAGRVALLGYAGLIVGASLLRTRDLRVALLSLPAAALQIFGYGSGFIAGFLIRPRNYDAPEPVRT
jgi:glycosyltransferase involved in cell wall biosynthesis